MKIDSTGIGATLLTITFVVLKAMHYIDWSWWLVFSPLWAPLLLAIGLVLAWGIIVMVGNLGDIKITKRRIK